jgi:RimJ/RimL family protein N-acetyltransferase
VGDGAAGTVRLDRCAVAGCPDGYEVSIAVAPDYRRSGIGKAALTLARQLVGRVPLLARIKPENEASRRLFAACGYRAFAAGVFVRWPDGHGPDIPGQETAVGERS